MTRPESHRRPDLLDGFLAIVFAFLCVIAANSLMPRIGWPATSALILVTVAFLFWFASGKPAVMLLKSHFLHAAFYWIAGCASVYWFGITPRSAIIVLLPSLMLSEFAQFAKHSKDAAANQTATSDH